MKSCMSILTTFLILIQTSSGTRSYKSLSLYTLICVDFESVHLCLQFIQYTFEMWSIQSIFTDSVIILVVKPKAWFRFPSKDFGWEGMGMWERGRVGWVDCYVGAITVKLTLSWLFDVDIWVVLVLVAALLFAACRLLFSSSDSLMAEKKKI